MRFPHIYLLSRPVCSGQFIHAGSSQLAAFTWGVSGVRPDTRTSFLFITGQWEAVLTSTCPSVSGHLGCFRSVLCSMRMRHCFSVRHSGCSPLGLLLSVLLRTLLNTFLFGPTVSFFLAVHLRGELLAPAVSLCCCLTPETVSESHCVLSPAMARSTAPSCQPC